MEEEVKKKRNRPTGLKYNVKNKEKVIAMADESTWSFYNPTTYKKDMIAKICRHFKRNPGQVMLVNAASGLSHSYLSKILNDSVGDEVRTATLLKVAKTIGVTEVNFIFKL